MARGFFVLAAALDATAAVFFPLAGDEAAGTVAAGLVAVSADISATVKSLLLWIGPAATVLGGFLLRMTRAVLCV